MEQIWSYTDQYQYGPAARATWSANSDGPDATCVPAGSARWFAEYHRCSAVQLDFPDMPMALHSAAPRVIFSLLTTAAPAGTSAVDLKPAGGVGGRFDDEASVVITVIGNNAQQNAI